MESVLMKRKEIMERWGLTAWKFRAMVDMGALVPIRMRDRRGRPRGYSWFDRRAVETAMGKMLGKDGAA